MSKFGDELKTLNDTKDYTEQFRAEDCQDNKGMAIIAYLGILVLIPLFAAKKSPFARFHTNQGLLLFIAGIIVGLINLIFQAIPVLGTIIYILCMVIDIILVILMVIGIVNAATGKAKDLPLIGTIRILK